MEVNILFFKTVPRLSKIFQNDIELVTEKHCKIAMKILSLDLLNVVIYPKPELTIKETGVGGFAPNSDWIRISINQTLEKEELHNIINNILPLSIYHEINHTSRWKETGYGENFIDVVVSEGLAVVFAEENWSKFIAPWGRYSKKDEKIFIKLIKENLNINKKYHHQEWFFGKGDKKWLGYKIGTFLIREVRKKYPEILWVDLMKMDSLNILKLSQIVLI